MEQNKEIIIKEIIEILSTSNYIDPAEHLYDGLKIINREITFNTVHDFLWALESSTILDVDGKVNECIKKIKTLLKHMNKEKYNHIVDEAWKKYLDETMFTSNPKWLEPVEVINKKTGEICWGARQYHREGFINKCKTDSEFSDKWGLKIEERELSLDERSVIAGSNHNEVSQNIKMFTGLDEDHTLHKNLDENNIPTKLITITYKNEIIEVYE